MPLVIICTPGHPVPGFVRDNLAAARVPYVIECHSQGRTYCPICASSANIRKQGVDHDYECWNCFFDFWRTLRDDGTIVTSTDDPKKRQDNP